MHCALRVAMQSEEYNEQVQKIGEDWTHVLGKHLIDPVTERPKYKGYPPPDIREAIARDIADFRANFHSNYPGFERFFAWFDFRCQWYLSDLLAMKDDYRGALEAFPEIPAEKIRSFLTNWRLNLELLVGQECTATDLLSVLPKNLTTFGQENLTLVEQCLDFLLESWAVEHRCGILAYIAGKYTQRRTWKHLFFTGAGPLIEFREPSFCFPEIEEFSQIVWELVREAENTVREESGMPRVGEGWVSETELYHKIRKWLDGYEVVHHARPPWLGQQHLDIYVPALALAIEYQGAQHDRAVEFFGGEEALAEAQKRDIRKRRLCKRNKVELIEVREGYELGEVKARIRQACGGQLVLPDDPAK